MLGACYRPSLGKKGGSLEGHFGEEIRHKIDYDSNTICIRKKEPNGKGPRLFPVKVKVGGTRRGDDKQSRSLNLTL